MLFRCIKHIKNDKEEVTAIEMSFEFLDDFQDPIKGGLYGLVHSCCQRLSTQDDSFELEEANASQAMGISHITSGIQQPESCPPVDGIIKSWHVFL